MRYNSTRPFLLPFILVVLFGVSDVGSQEMTPKADAPYVVVMTDEFDKGTGLWTFSDTPVVSMDWDTSEGSPKPGSLRLSQSEALLSSTGFFAAGNCMNAEPGERWRIEVMRKKESDYGYCLAYVQFFEEPNCTGEGTIIGNFHTHDPDEWQMHSWAALIYPQVHSVRPILSMIGTTSGTMSCNFDSVTLYNDRAPTVTDVPTLTAVGYLIIGSLLALAGCILLARRSDLR